MEQPDTNPARVGQQLAQRREDLDLTQEELAQRIGISTATVSAAERGRNIISRGRRSDWERALGLRPGTLSRAYRDGSPIEILGQELRDPEPPQSDDEGGRVLHNRRNIEAVEGWLASLRDRWELEDDPDERDTILRVITKIVRYTGVAPPPPPDEAQRRPGRRAG